MKQYKLNNRQTVLVQAQKGLLLWLVAIVVFVELNGDSLTRRYTTYQLDFCVRVHVVNRGKRARQILYYENEMQRWPANNGCQ